MNEQYVCPDADFKRWSINEDCGCQGGMISYHQVPRVGCDCDAINQEFDNLWDAIDEIEVSGSCDCEAIEAHFQTIGEDISTLSGKVITLENTMPLKADKATTYTKSEVDALISGITPSSGSCECDLTEVNDRLTALESVSGQCHCSFDDYYTKEQVDALISGYTPSPQPSDRNFLAEFINDSGVVTTIACSVSGSVIYGNMVDALAHNVILNVGDCATEIASGFSTTFYPHIRYVDLRGRNLRKIGKQAFAFADVERYYIPSSVEEIGDYAFNNGQDLHIEIIFEASVPPTHIGLSNSGSYHYVTIYVPKGSKELYESVYNLYQYRDNGKIIEY